MGTNYYWKTEPCSHCGRGGESKHIGKSSMGWVFALHVYPEDGILDLPDWYERWKQKGASIYDEYGKELQPTEMLAVVLARIGRTSGAGYDDPTFARENQAVLGPFGLWRARVGHGCIGHGSGTYDLHVGDFS